MKTYFDLLNEDNKIYTDAILCDKTLYLSGVAPFTESGELIGRKNAAEQTKQVIKNIQLILRHFQMDLSDVVKLTVYLKNIKDRGAVASVRQQMFGKIKPASTLIGVNELGHPDMLLEIELIAVKD